MLKCSPYIKDLCQNINQSFFTEDTAEDGDKDVCTSSPPKQTEVRVTDVKSSAFKDSVQTSAVAFHVALI